MAKPKAPRWLTEAFRDGVDEREGTEKLRTNRPAYVGASKYCRLAKHDPALRPCKGPLERFHFIGRQRVENAMYAMLLGAEYTPWVYRNEGAAFHGIAVTTLVSNAERDDLILLAAWDPRNGGLACEGHHRRFDDHMVSLPRDRIVVPYSALPAHVIYFAFDYGLDHLLDKFPSSI